MTSFDISFIDDFWHVQRDGVSVSMHSLRCEAVLARGRYSSETEGTAGCNHWPRQVRCCVCGMGLSSEECRTVKREDLAAIICDALWGTRDFAFRNDEVKEAGLRVADAVLSHLHAQPQSVPSRTKLIDPIDSRALRGAREQAMKDRASMLSRPDRS